MCNTNNVVADWATRQLFTLKTPHAMARASEHFGATVLYVELENSGGAGEQGVLLEDRIYYGEVMTFPTAGKRLYRSAVSMGLLQDTGWYAPLLQRNKPVTTRVVGAHEATLTEEKSNFYALRGVGAL